MWYKPSEGRVIALELELVPAMSVQRRSARSSGGGGASRHLAAHPLWIEARVLSVGRPAQANLVL
jgi:hypothetical protein